MGSGTSKSSSPNTTGSQNGGTKSETQSPEKLPGSSVPPKGLPNQRLTGSKVVENGNKGTRKVSVSTNEITTKSSQETTTNIAGGVKREKTEIRNKSAHLRRNDTKNLVRKMEMGMEDENDVDNILGLDRMKTKMQLKKEKTRLKMNQPKGKFQQAAMKIQSGAKKQEGPRTELDEIYMGNVSVECPSTAKVVRIFTSSTFTDTMHERNKLMENAYPKIKGFCQELGYDFQVVDMRWGVRDEAADDHMTTEICLKELEMCQRVSTGPNFVSLMSHKYGYTDFPRCIDAAEYEEIIKHITAKETLNLFNKWYTKDTNAVPPVYAVHPISFHIPDFVSTDKEKKTEAKKQWWSESETIQATLEEVAQKVFDAETARKYIRSVTETEIFNGIIKADRSANTCIWLKRTIEDIENQECNYQLSRYIECTHNNSDEKVKKTRGMLNQLKKQIDKKLSGNIMEYSIKWNKDKGIDPSSEDHRNYLTKLSNEFVAKLCSMIFTAVQEKKKTGGPLIEEIVQHLQFCQEKCRNFHGRDDVLKQIKFYVKGMSNEPLVLYGPSGCGKTSIMAMAAKQCAEWTNNKAAVVLRVRKCHEQLENLEVVDPHPGQPYLAKLAANCMLCSSQSADTDHTTKEQPELLDNKTAWSQKTSAIPHSFSYLDILSYSKHSGKNTNYVEKPIDKGYAFYFDGYVFNQEVGKCGDSVKVKAKCYRSMRKSEAPHSLLVSLNSAGAVTSGKCSCVAGASGHCNHVYALLYSIDHVVKLKSETFQRAQTCTDKPAEWTKSRTNGISSEPVMTATVVKPKYGSNSKGIRSTLYEARSRESRHNVEISKDFVHKLSKVNPLFGVCMTVGNETQNAPTRMGFSVPRGSPLSYQLSPTEGNFSVTANMPRINGTKPIDNDIPTFPWSDTYVEAVPQSILTDVGLDVNKEQATDIFNKTKDQSACKLWFDVRRSRLTASRFGAIMRRKKDKEKFIRDQLITTKDLTKVPAVRYGRENESKATEKYVDYMANTGRSVKVYGSGCVINPNFPWLAGSPDGIVCDEEVGFGLMEIKCSYSNRNITPIEACRDPTFFCEVRDGNMNLKTDHEYYAQVQGQLGICGAKFCDFVVYTNKGLGIQRIPFDRQYWEEMTGKLRGFFLTYFLPVINS